MTRFMSGVKLIDRKNTEELLQMLGITVPVERMVRASAVRWYGRTLQRGYILKVALNLEVTGRRKNERPKATWKKKQVEIPIKDIDLRKESAPSRKKMGARC